MKKYFLCFYVFFGFSVWIFSQNDSLNTIKDTCHINTSWYNADYWNDIYVADTNIMIDIWPFVDCTQSDCSLFVSPSCPVKEFSLIFYNRWGEILFDSSDPEKGWYAYDTADGVYIYCISGIWLSDETFKYCGHVTILHTRDEK